MNKSRKWIVTTLAAVSMLIGGAVWAEGRYSTIEVFFDRIHVAINGQSATLNKDSIIYDGTVYVPLRSLSEMLGADVGWNSTTRTVDIDFLANRTDALYGASKKAIYQYIAIENNRIMSDMLDALQQNDMDKLKQLVERIGNLRDVAGDIGDADASAALDKMAAAAELVRSGYINKKMDDYGIAWVIFKDSENKLILILNQALAK
ncbi:MAG: hypothetical protein J7639_10210 [Paenibacillaceae bacterium]|nr:hypothetical protein [Paenibacillaceae bacterium]